MLFLPFIFGIDISALANNKWIKGDKIARFRLLGLKEFYHQNFSTDKAAPTINNTWCTVWCDLLLLLTPKQFSAVFGAI